MITNLSLHKCHQMILFKTNRMKSNKIIKLIANIHNLLQLGLKIEREV